MALTSPTAALVNVVDGSGATQAIASGGTALLTPGGLASFSLQSTAGIARWTLTISAPGSKIDGQRYEWTSGQANLIQFPVPQQEMSGLLYGFSSTVSDGVQSIVTAYGYIQTLGGVGIPDIHTADVTTVTALSAYTNVSGTLTCTTNAAITSTNLDGVTPTVGMRVLLNSLGATNGTSATVDPGIYQIVAVGSGTAPFVMTRVGDMPQGMIMAPGMKVEVNQGTVFGNSEWKSTLVGPNTVGTSAPAFYPKTQKGSGSTGGGTTISLTTLFSLSSSSVICANDNSGAAAVEVGAIVAGAGTGTCTLTGTTGHTISWVLFNW